MYLQHFGMRELPFRLTPDTSYFYNYANYHEALNVLLVAIRSGEGFIKIVGEVGTGKTLLCRKLLATLDEEFVTAYIPNPYLTPSALRMALADELNIKYDTKISLHRLLKLINDKLVELTAAGKQVVLCLDEAQAMPEETLEALRLLTNLETEKQKLLQIVLFGQPELDEILSRRSVRQLKQRIAFSFILRPIDRDGLNAYIGHRLLVAGYTGRPLFSHAALMALFKASRGVPRIINILSHKALMSAYGRGEKTIDRKHIRAAIKDTEGIKAPRRRLFQFADYGIMSAILFATSMGLYYFLGISG